MTILLMDGFDLYNGTDAPTGLAACWTLDNSYATVAMVTGRFGGQCFKTLWKNAAQYSVIQRALSATTSAFSFGLAIQMSAFSASPFVWLLDAGGAYQFCVRTDASGNLYACRASTRLGERKISVLNPTADVAKGFTPSTGTSNYACLDEGVVSTTDYVTASDLGATDTYDFADLSDTPARIDAIQLTAFAQKTDATTRALALQVISGSTTDDGASFNLNATFTSFSRLLATDPATGAAWTAAAVNALRAGPKVAV